MAGLKGEAPFDPFAKNSSPLLERRVKGRRSLHCVTGSPSPLKEKIRKGVLEGRSSSKETNFPLPLIKGKGIKGMGLPNKNLKGWG